jgi:hypothetical protein
MKTHLIRFLEAALVVACMSATIAAGGNVTKTVTVDSMRIELHVLPAEPFFTAGEVAAQHASQGMLVMGGAAPAAPDAQSRPNHHLVVHVFNAKTGAAVTDAVVIMNFRPLDDKGKPSGASVNVPVVVMQAIGKGAQSTHYGNNVFMAAGSYAVNVTVNGKPAHFKATVAGSDSDMKHEMHM